MPKLDEVTEAEIKAAIASGEDMLMALHDFNNRIEKGYVANIEKPAELARSLSNMATACSRACTLLLAKLAMQEDKRELERLMAERAKLKG